MIFSIVSSEDRDSVLCIQQSGGFFYPTTETELGFDQTRLQVVYAQSVALYIVFTKAFFAFRMSRSFQDARVNAILFTPTRKAGPSLRRCTRNS
jgi:hypothetical protein